jgi:hypothetical protein
MPHSYLADFDRSIGWCLPVSRSNHGTWHTNTHTHPVLLDALDDLLEGLVGGAEYDVVEHLLDVFCLGDDGDTTEEDGPPIEPPTPERTWMKRR